MKEQKVISANGHPQDKHTVLVSPLLKPTGTFLSPTGSDSEVELGTHTTLMVASREFGILECLFMASGPKFQSHPEITTL
jgi:hypothetical protein